MVEQELGRAAGEEWDVVEAEWDGAGSVVEDRRRLPTSAPSLSEASRK